MIGCDMKRDAWFFFFASMIIVFFSYKEFHLIFNAERYSEWFPSFCKIMLPVCCIVENILLVRQKRIVTKDVFVAIYPVVVYLLMLLNPYEEYKIGHGILPLLLGVQFFLLNDDTKARIFYLFYRLFVFLSLISILIWFLYFLFGTGVFLEMPYYSDRPLEKYFVLGPVGIFVIDVPGYIGRLCGVFNEPGGMGTICGLLIALTFSIAQKKDIFLIFVAGCLTQSAAFFCIVCLVLVFYCLKKDIVFGIFLIALLINIIFLIPYLNFDNDWLNNLVQRFAFVDGHFVGDNRTTAGFDYFFHNFVNSDAVFFGYGDGFDAYERGNSSYKEYIVKYGVVGFCGLVIYLICISFWYIRHDVMLGLYLFLFILSLYQRTYPLISLSGYLLLFGGYAFYIGKKKCSLNIKKYK